MDIAVNLTDLLNDLRKGRTNLIAKGVEISPMIGFSEAMDKILEIQSTVSTGTVIDDSISLVKQVPVNSISHCYVKSLGGMTYKSNNLFSLPYAVADVVTSAGITFTVNADRSITLNGTPTGATDYVYAKLPLTAGTYTYTLVGNSKLTSVVSFRRKSNGVALKNLGNVSPNKSALTFTITAEEAAEYNIWVNIYSSSGELKNETVYPMLNMGATALPYEPYFEGLRDNKATAIKAYGANLIPFPYAIGGVGFTQTKGGITFTINADRSFTVKGTANGTPAFGIVSGLNLPTDVDYYLSGNCVGGEWVSGVQIYTATPNYVYYYSQKTTPTVKIPSGTNFSWISVQILNGTTIDATFKPMLSRAQALPYTDYKEPATYLIPEALQGTGKGINSTYHDSINFENGKKNIKVGEILLKNLNWTYTSTYGFYSYGNKNNFIGNRLLCDSYTTDTWSNVYEGKTDRCISGNGQAIIISDARYTDDASFKASLGDKKLIYALAEPTEANIDTFAFDPLIKVEGGGSLEIITDNGGVVPSTIIYQTIV